MMTNKVRAIFRQWFGLDFDDVPALKPLRNIAEELIAIAVWLARINKRLVEFRDYGRLVAVRVVLKDAVAEEPAKVGILAPGETGRVVFRVTEDAKAATFSVTVGGGGDKGWLLVHVVEVRVGNEVRPPESTKLGHVPAGTEVALVLKYDNDQVGK
jgi:hypothetical protein